MLPQSTKQMMQESLPFRFSFVAAIILFIAVCIMNLVNGSAVSIQFRTHSSCQQASSYYNRECYDKSNTYCCYTDSYSYCGSSYYCKPLSSFEYRQWVPCWGLLIAIWICSVLCFIFFVVVMVMFCYFRKRYRKQFLMNSMNYANVQPIIHVNPVPPVNKVPINHNKDGMAQSTKGLYYD